jgi:ribonuclease D
LTLAAIEKERDGEEAWRISGSGILRGLAAAIFRELWRWRDQEARHVDRPSFHILRNEELLAAAKGFADGQNPRFEHLRGSRRERFYDAVERARQLPEAAWPVLAKRPFSRWTGEEEKRAAALKNVRDKAAAELNLDPSIIAARATLETLAVRAEAADELLMPWQRSLLSL